MARTLPNSYKAGLSGTSKNFYLVRAELGYGTGSVSTTAWWSSIAGIGTLGGVTANYSPAELKIVPSTTALAAFISDTQGALIGVDTIGEVDMSFDTIAGGGFADVNETSVRFLNVTGFQNYINQYHLENRPIEIWEGYLTGSTGVLTVTADMVNVFKGVMRDSGAVDYTTFEILCTDSSITDQILIPNIKITKTGFPTADVDDYGEVLPVLFGDFKSFDEESVTTSGSTMYRYYLGRSNKAPIMMLNGSTLIGVWSSQPSITGHPVFFHDPDGNWLGQIDANSTTYALCSSTAAVAAGGSSQAEWTSTVTGPLTASDLSYIKFVTSNPLGSVYVKPKVVGDRTTKEQIPPIDITLATDHDESTTARIDSYTVAEWKFDDFYEPGTYFNHTHVSGAGYHFVVSVLYHTSTSSDNYHLYVTSSDSVSYHANLGPTNGTISASLLAITLTGTYAAVNDWEGIKTLGFKIQAANSFNLSQCYIREFGIVARNGYTIQENTSKNIVKFDFRSDGPKSPGPGWKLTGKWWNWYEWTYTDKQQEPTHISNLGIAAYGCKYGSWVDSE